MPLLRKFVKAGKIVWAFGYSLSALVLLRPKSRGDRAAWLTRFCRRVLRAADVSYAAHGPVPAQGAVITNHLSYLDILVHAALRPCVFVSAIETRKMPLIGWISMMAGTVYVVRGSGGSAAKAAGGMAEGFRDGLPVIFFPEGRTGSGEVPLLPLHTGLLANALDTGVSVTPGFIRYALDPADLVADRTIARDVAWTTQTLPAHLWNLMGLKPFTGSITFAAEPIAFSSEAFDDRKVAAAQSQEALLAVARAQNIDLPQK